MKKYWLLLTQYISNMLIHSIYRVQQPPVRCTKGMFLDSSSFDISSRRLYLLVSFFILAGYKVSLKHRFRFIAGLSGYGKLILKTKNVTVSFRAPANSDILLADCKRRNTVQVSVDYFQKGSSNTFHMPMTMHPLIYRNELYKKCERLAQNKERTIDIFFAGNLDPELYTKGTVEHLFDKLERVHMFEIIANSLRDILCTPASMSELLNSGDKQLVVVDKRVFSIPQEEFLDVMSKAKFFIAPPGIRTPLCHNIIEAMSVGSIPILQSPEMFSPNLRHRENCLVFSDEEGLLLQIQEALGMTEGQIEKMRNAVIQYYRNYLTPSAVIGRIEDQLPQLNTIYVNDGSASTGMLENRVFKSNSSGSDFLVSAHDTLL